MFKELKPLLDSAKTLSLTLTLNDDGTITTTVIPKCANAVLNVPLSLTGTAEELDQEFAGIVGKYNVKRESLSEQFARTDAIIESAKEESKKKAADSLKKKNEVKPGKKDGDKKDAKPDAKKPGRKPGKAPAVAAPVTAGEKVSEKAASATGAGVFEQPATVQTAGANLWD